MIMIYPCLFFLILFPLTCGYPFLLWKIDLFESRLIGNAGIRKGNGLVLSESQQDLWAVDTFGSLHVIRLWKGNLHEVFNPESVPMHQTESRSSVLVFKDKFVAYAVIDSPKADALQELHR
jgi:hypothetical protein